MSEVVEKPEGEKAESPELDMDEVIMGLIVGAGSARSYAFEAIYAAKDGKIEDAKASLQQAEDELVSAHHVQTDLIQRTIRGEKIEIGLLMVHAQDHLMTGILAKDLAREMVELYEKLDAAKVQA